MSEPPILVPSVIVERQTVPTAAWPGRLGPTLGRFARSSSAGAACGLMLLLIALLAIFADRLAPFDPLAADYGQTRYPPSAQHLLGTDHLGRDVLSRVLFGARVTMLVGVVSVLIGDGIGFAWGLTSGYAGHRFDLVSQRLVEVLMSFPTLILALLLLIGLGAGLQTVIVAIAVTRVPGSSRIVRSVVLAVKEYAFVEATRCIGATPLRIVVRHIAPQCVAPMLVVASLNLGTAIFAESALSFLGVGIPPPTPSWGNMLGGVLLGDALRDFLDPKLRQRV